MKKSALIILLSLVFGYAHAQHIVLAQPNTLNNLNKTNIVPIDTNKITSQTSGIVAVQSGLIKNDIIVYSRMPVSKVQGFNSKMPVQGKGNKITGYNMPVKRVQIINPDTLDKGRINP